MIKLISISSTSNLTFRSTWNKTSSSSYEKSYHFIEWSTRSSDMELRQIYEHQGTVLLPIWLAGTDILVDTLQSLG